MKKFELPQMELITLMDDDVITTSDGCNLNCGSQLCRGYECHPCSDGCYGHTCQIYLCKEY